MCLCGQTLKMTETVFLCEQHSTAIYIHCVTVWVSSLEKATKMINLKTLFNLQYQYQFAMTYLTRSVQRIAIIKVVTLLSTSCT
jgi:hypothetical protein